MARTVVTSRKTVINYTYSLKFLEANNVLTLPASSIITTDISSAFTILLKVRLDSRSTPTNDLLTLLTDNGGSINKVNYQIIQASSSKKVQVRISNGTTQDIVLSDATMTPSWQWVGMSYNAGVSLSSIVGKTIKSKVPAITAALVSTRVSTISINLAPQYVHGNIARFWIFGGVISQAELNNLVDNGVQPSSLTTKLLYNFTDGSGTTVTDSSGNNLNGTITGASWDANDVPSKTRIIESGRFFATDRTIAI